VAITTGVGEAVGVELGPVGGGVGDDGDEAGAEADADADEADAEADADGDEAGAEADADETEPEAAGSVAARGEAPEVGAWPLGQHDPVRDSVPPEPHPADRLTMQAAPAAADRILNQRSIALRLSFIRMVSYRRPQSVVPGRPEGVDHDAIVAPSRSAQHDVSECLAEGWRYS
jgi:hypothetical protein